MLKWSVSPWHRGSMRRDGSAMRDQLLISLRQMMRLRRLSSLQRLRHSITSAATFHARRLRLHAARSVQMGSPYQIQRAHLLPKAWSPCAANGRPASSVLLPADSLRSLLDQRLLGVLPQAPLMRRWCAALFARRAASPLHQRCARSTTSSSVTAVMTGRAAVPSRFRDGRASPRDSLRNSQPRGVSKRRSSPLTLSRPWGLARSTPLQPSPITLPRLALETLIRSSSSAQWHLSRFASLVMGVTHA